MSKSGSRKPNTHTKNKFRLNAKVAMDPSIKKDVIVTIGDASDEEDKQSLEVEKQVYELLTIIDKYLQVMPQIHGNDYFEDVSSKMEWLLEDISKNHPIERRVEIQGIMLIMYKTYKTQILQHR